MHHVFVMLLIRGSVYSSTPQYTHSDSLKVVDVLRRAATQRSGTNMMLYFPSVSWLSLCGKHIG